MRLLSPPELLARATLLVCEAHPALQEAFQLLLEEARHVTVVSTLQATLASSQEAIPDLLLIDLDGQESILLQLERLTMQYPNLRILLIAGDFSLEFQQAAVHLGITSFQTKPWNSAHFTERIDTLLRGHALNPLRHIVKVRST